MNDQQKKLLRQLKRPFMGTGIRVHYESVDGVGGCFVFTRGNLETAIEMPMNNYNDYYKLIVKGVKIAFARASRG